MVSFDVYFYIHRKIGNKYRIIKWKMNNMEINMHFSASERTFLFFNLRNREFKMYVFQRWGIVWNA